MMSAGSIVNRLSHHQREVLIAHVVRDQPINAQSAARIVRQITRALIERKLVTYAGHYRTKRPRFTTLTELGHEVAAMVLGNYADALVRAGCLDEIKSLKLSPTALREMRLLITSVPALTES